MTTPRSTLRLGFGSVKTPIIVPATPSSAPASARTTVIEAECNTVIPACLRTVGNVLDCPGSHSGLALSRSRLNDRVERLLEGSLAADSQLRLLSCDAANQVFNHLRGLPSRCGLRGLGRRGSSFVMCL